MNSPSRKTLSGFFVLILIAIRIQIHHVGIRRFTRHQLRMVLCFDFFLRQFLFLTVTLMFITHKRTSVKEPT